MPYAEVRALKGIYPDGRPVQHVYLYFPYQDKEVDSKIVPKYRTKKGYSALGNKEYTRPGTVYFRLRNAPFSQRLAGQHRLAESEYDNLPTKAELKSSLRELIQERYSGITLQSAAVLFPRKNGRKERHEIIYNT